MSLQSYQDLVAWRKSMRLVKFVYQTTRRFPREERYGLKSQIRRASVSVPSNIAEGQGRGSTKDFMRHLSIAYGSLMELETQILIAESLRYIRSEERKTAIAKTSEVGRLINGLLRALRKRTGH